MKANHIAGKKNIDIYVDDKLHLLEKTENTFSALFELMFSERENVFFEEDKGFRMIHTTYGAAYDTALKAAGRLRFLTGELPADTVIGIAMANGPEWVEVFWAILAAGYRPLLINTMMEKKLTEDILQRLQVPFVISDRLTYSCSCIFSSDLFPEGPEKALPQNFGSEFFVLSSGTSENVKICAYSAEEIRYQIMDSARIIKECPQMKKHYEGELKQLAFLPFYHIFGLFAVYFWFGFFSRTFVKLNDMNPATIIDTIQRHKVTHIFAVPLFWERVYETARSTIRGQGKKIAGRFSKGMKIADALSRIPPLFNAFSHVAFREVRENMFGESVQFMISGGGMIAGDVLKFFNGIGYHLVNGYGMSEVGITSVELGRNLRRMNSGSVGRPFYSLEYRINEAGELLIGGKTRARRIICGEDVFEREEFYNSHDLTEEKRGCYYILGRSDELIVSSSGENINPNRIEAELVIDGIHQLVAVQGEKKLVIIASPSATLRSADELIGEIRAGLIRMNYLTEVEKILLVEDDLIEADGFKVNRKEIRRKYLREGFTPYCNTGDVSEKRSARSALAGRVRQIFCKSLNVQPEEVDEYSNFFADLGGDSLAYLGMIADLEAEFRIEFPSTAEKSLYTIHELTEYLEQNNDEHNR